MAELAAIKGIAKIEAIDELCLDVTFKKEGENAK